MVENARLSSARLGVDTRVNGSNVAKMQPEVFCYRLLLASAAVSVVDIDNASGH